MHGAATQDVPVGGCRSDPPDTSDGEGLQQWVCRLHNSVNRRIGKPTFNCQLVSSRWAPLDCGEEGSSCDMLLGSGRRK
jgi:mitochondrial FAD-linked sulfhydryl oxidase